jgi:hypothetical protein
MAKTLYQPLKTPGKSGIKITVPNWVPVAKAYKFEFTPDKKLVYTPVME